MPNYIMLISWTDQGVKAYANSLDRAEAAAQQLATKFGGNLKQIYWTMGAYDLVSVLEAPDDETATAFALAISSLGTVRTSTLRALTPRRCARSSTRQPEPP